MTPRERAQRLVEEKRPHGLICAADIEAVIAEAVAVEKEQAVRITAAKDGAYAERNRVVAALARLALRLGWRAGLGRHVDTPGDPPWEDDWRNIVFVDLPPGQVTWHLHDSELPLFAGLPDYGGSYDGHSTEEKYRRLASLPLFEGEAKA